MNNNQFTPNAISHKALNILMNKAIKETAIIDSAHEDEIIKNKNFNYLIRSWEEKSQELLLTLSENEELFTNNKTSKSLMAFGAMKVHISMALQALKATESDQ